MAETSLGISFELKDKLAGMTKRNEAMEHVVYDLFNFKRLWEAKNNNSLIQVTWGDAENPMIRKGHVMKMERHGFCLKLNPENKMAYMDLRGIVKIEEVEK